MKISQKTIFFTVIIVLILGTIGTVIVRGSGSGVKVDYGPFATCLKDNGALFYGASWCVHCQAQKKLFGKAEKLLPYIECSTPNGGEQLQICKDAKIGGYPTWKFADGTELTGKIPLATLAEKTSCVLPEAPVPETKQ